MDGTIRRIVEEVVKEYHLESGFLLRVVELEETMAHLSRRHGIFEELRNLSRKSAQRVLNAQGENRHEN
jgi:hypothetical protein